MTGEEPERSSRGRRTGIVITGVLLLAAVLLLIIELMLRRQLDTEHVQRRLQAQIASATDSLYQIRIESSRFSWLGRSFVLTGFTLLPDTAAFRRRAGDRLLPRTRYRVSAASLSFDGIPFWPLFGRQFVARTAILDSLQVDIRYDKTRAKNPEAVTRLPQYYVAGMTKPLQIEWLTVRRAGLRFTEREVDGTRFGTLPFDSIEATIANLSNVRRGRGNGLSVIDLRMLLAGAGPTVARFEYDLSKPKLNLKYHGSVSRMDGRAFNQMLEELEGYRIRSGRLDSAWFQVDVKDDVATGKLKLLYDNFEIETLDKRTGEQSLGDWFRSFIANKFKLHEDNPAGEDPPRTAALRLDRGEFPIFKFIWVTLRGGIQEIIGLGGGE